MSTKSRVELIESLRASYLLAEHREKRRMLDQIVNATGYTRKHAISLLNGIKPVAVASRKRARHYDDAFKAILFDLWIASNRVCSKRLVALFETLIPALERHGRLTLEPATRAQLLKISPATVDRLLADARKALSGVKRRHVGNPHHLNVPVRTGPWVDPEPGFCEVDLVLHAGASVSGTFLHTLTVTDIATGWTETEALLRRGGDEVLTALKLIRNRFPVPLVGVDSDNGGEFMNDLLERYCLEEEIVFTHSRPYQSNDQAHVEQKNGAVVRRVVGYARFEGEKAHALMCALYTVLRLYVNFFQPSFKLISKVKVAGKILKKYDKPKTPYERLVATGRLSEIRSDKLRELFLSLDPTVLLQDLERLQSQLWRLSVDKDASTQAIVASKMARPKQRSSYKPKPVPHKKGGRKPIDCFADDIDQILTANPAMTSHPLYRILQRRYGGDVPSHATIARRLAEWRRAHPEFNDHFPKQFLSPKRPRKSEAPGNFLDEATQLVRV